ncbi:Diguanylate phosphodiesterase [Paracholeplasma brassicae]|uniref:Diguanylate phosphodiesterase n=1 Tax=Acholeplasma brassicae TaxID=61635 RepID=U4KSC8_9MOLU|nr:EAL domain-containing protein [Paracholeplasma brassicae]CCV66528.1 Diguanylate phosphodiesterase [Paracholeplasma brassicae]
MSKLTNRRLIFLGISLLYSSSYLLMYFNPFIHDNTPAFLLTGVLLLMIFLLFRDFLDKGLRVKVITGLVSLIVLFQLISELTTLHEWFKSNDIMHLIIHFIFGVNYVLLGYLVYFENENYQKNQSLRKAAFDYNQSILIRIDYKKRLVEMEFSEFLKEAYCLLKQTISIDLDEFRNWVVEEEHLRFDEAIKQKAFLNNDVFHIRLFEQKIELTMQIKGSYLVDFTHVILAFDYTDFESLEKTMYEENHLRMELLKNLKVGVIEIEFIYEGDKIVDYKHIYINEYFVDVVSVSKKELLEKTAKDLIPNDYLDRIEIYLDARKTNKPVSFERRITRNGRYCMITAYPSFNDHMVVIYQDVTELKALNDRLAYLATHNTLNAFYNQQGLEEHISKLKPVKDAVCFYASISKINSIKAFYGIQFIDKLIQEIGKEFLIYKKEGFIVANISYHHFILVLLEPKEELIFDVIDHANRSVYKKYHIIDTEINVKQNIGFSRISQEPVNLFELITQAAVANNEASQSEHNVIVKYEESHGFALKKNINMASKLYQAIENKQIDVYYQKIVDTRTNEVRYIEALARWIDPELGFVSPDEFFELASKSNLIDYLEDYLVQLAIKKFSRYLKKDYPKAILNLNLSPAALFKTNFELLVLEKTISSGLKTDDVCIEISENTFIRNTDLCIETINKFKRYGFRIAIDDFGSKYSSLGILDQVPFDILKLDGVFATNIQSPTILDIVRTLKDIAHKGQKDIVIEKVETIEISDKFKALGIYIQQGYFYHKPEKVG